MRGLGFRAIVLIQEKFGREREENHEHAGFRIARQETQVSPKILSPEIVGTHEKAEEP